MNFTIVKFCNSTAYQKSYTYSHAYGVLSKRLQHRLFLEYLMEKILKFKG